MALGAALVDRARVVRREEAGRKVEGTTTYGTTLGPWFKARLFPEISREQLDAANRRRIIPNKPTMLAALKDENGDRVLITNEARLEVDSAELGREVWDVTCEPQAIRKKRAVIGWYFSVQRVYTVESGEAA